MEKGRPLYFHAVVSIYLLLSSSSFSSPNLSGRRLDVYHTSTHGVVLCEFRMQVWNVLHAALWKCRTQKIVKNSPSGHHPTTLSGYIFATKACIDNREKTLLNSNVSLTYSQNMVSSLAGEICWRVWGTRAHFNQLRVLAALLHGTLVVGVSQTLQRWTESAATAGRPSRWALAHIQVSLVSCHIQNRIQPAPPTETLQRPPRMHAMRRTALTVQRCFGKYTLPTDAQQGPRKACLRSSHDTSWRRCFYLRAIFNSLLQYTMNVHTHVMPIMKWVCPFF